MVLIRRWNLVTAHPVALVQDAAQMSRAYQPALPHNILQEYLQALAEGQAEPSHRQQKLLHAYAELQYQLHGGGRCSACQAAVRHVLPVRAEHLDGAVAEFACLCTRCLEGERALSHRVILRVGQAYLEYTSSQDKPKSKTFRAYAP